MAKLSDTLIKSIADFVNGEIQVDLGAIIEGLILYDRLIIHSVRFLELNALVQCFGVQGLLELLKDGALQFYFDAIAVGQIDQQPNGIYRFESVKVTDPVGYQATGIELAIDKIPNLKAKEKEILKSGIDVKVLRHPNGTIEQITSSFKKELQNDDRILPSAISKFLSYKMGLVVDPDRIRTEVQPVDENYLRIGSNLRQLFRISEGEVNEVLERAALAIASRNMKIAEMRNFNALVGFRNDEVPIFEQKFSFLAKQLDPNCQSKTFDRVLTISNFPDFRSTDLRRVDANKLLDLRRTTECIEFRRWISEAESASDKEIAEQINSLRTKLGNFLGGTKGKVIRFLAGAGIGAVVNPAVSVALDAIDTFLIDKILPSNTAIAFLQRDLPSIFDDR